MTDLTKLLKQYLTNVQPGNDDLPVYFQAYLQVLNTFGYQPIIQPGKIQLLGWELSYICGASLLGQIDATLVRGLNDFIPENDHPLILDCGSNIGLTVLHYKRKYPNSRIIAFEPDVNFLPALRQNLVDNHISGVEVVDAAVWIENGQLAWYQEGIDGSHIGADKAGNVPSTNVRSIDLGDFLDNPVDLIKMDIEGAEFSVIKHVRKKLHNVKALSIECHIDQSSVLAFGEMLGTLSESGFHVSVSGGVGPWRDLVYQPALGGEHHENYILVSAWQGAIPHLDTPSPWLQNVGIAPVLEAANQIQYLDQHFLQIAETELHEYLGALVSRGENGFIRTKLKGPYQHMGGAGWVAPLPALTSASDNSDFPQKSRLHIFENGHLLQPGHSVHAEICSLGAGRYSHWDQVLYFSSSDNSNPNTNGREYKIVAIS